MRFSVRGIMLRTFLLGGKGMELYEIFHEFFTEIGITNNLLLKLCEDEEQRELLLKQQKAVGKAMNEYHAMLEEKNQ